MKYGAGMLPESGRPDIARETAIEWARNAGCDASVFLFGRRGYYRDTMGVAGTQERSIYDDAMGIVTPTEIITFNANTDPDDPDTDTRLATLIPGVYDYKVGTHNLSKPKEKQYECFVQAGPVTVLRDNGVQETGMFGINLHAGFFGECGSAGCQTVPPTQYGTDRAKMMKIEAELTPPLFLDSAKRIMQAHGLTVIKYVLTARADE